MQIYAVRIACTTRARFCAHSSRATLQDGQFQSLFLAAADDETRQRCVRALQAATSRTMYTSMQELASAVAITPDLIGMRNMPAVNSVLVSLGKSATNGFDAKSLKVAGLTAKELRAAGFGLWDIIDAGFYDTESSVVSHASQIARGRTPALAYDTTSRA